MAGTDRMYDDLFRRTGVIRAQTFGDLLDISAALATRRVLRGRRIASSRRRGRRHACVRQGDLRIRGPGADELAAVALRALQSGDHTSLDRNPIDVALAGLRPDLRRGVIPALLASATYDVLVIVGSSGVRRQASVGPNCWPARSKTACGCPTNRSWPISVRMRPRPQLCSAWRAGPRCSGELYGETELILAMYAMPLVGHPCWAREA
ncbi:hypothetical protein ABL849_33110 (plasmid) [Variovorax sp. 375MFSha3.1]